MTQHPVSRCVTCARRPSASAATARAEIFLMLLAMPLPVRSNIDLPLILTPTTHIDRPCHPSQCRHVTADARARPQSP
jgi:hypothetical protein